MGIKSFLLCFKSIEAFGITFTLKSQENFIDEKKSQEKMK